METLRSTAITIPVSETVLQIICERCVKEATVHYVSTRRTFNRFIHVECHGEHRLGVLPEYVTRVAAYTSAAGRLALLWSQFGDEGDLALLASETGKGVKRAKLYLLYDDLSDDERVEIEAAIMDSEALLSHIGAVKCWRDRHTFGDA